MEKTFSEGDTAVLPSKDRNIVFSLYIDRFEHKLLVDRPGVAWAVLQTAI